MILIATHEPGIFQSLKSALHAIGSRVVCRGDPSEALEFADDDEPELVVAELALPGMSGPALRAEYVRRFPERQTLFAFLAESSEIGDVVKALEAGGDDFYVKPIDEELVAARVRILLQRVRLGIRTRFRGDIKHLPFMEVLQFCERQALTGRVRFNTPKGRFCVCFQAGNIVDDEDFSNRIGELRELDSGTFVIESQPMRFEEIETARKLSMMPPRALDEVPIGRLSGVRVGTRLFRLQTEYEPLPTGRIVSVAILNEEEVKRQESPVPKGIGRDQLWALIDGQHEKIERSVRDTIDGFFRKHSSQQVPAQGSESRPAHPHHTPPPIVTKQIESDPPSKMREPKAPRLPPPLPDSDSHGLEVDSLDDDAPMSGDKDALFDLALRKWRERDLKGALALVEAAHAVSPNDRAIQAFQKVLRRKMMAQR